MIRKLSALLAVLALVVAGCGGDDGEKENYERQATAVAKTLDEAFTVLAEDPAKADPADIAAKLQVGADSLAKAAAGLAEIDPPSDIEDAHDRIVKGLEKLADQFGEAATAAEEGDTDAVIEFGEQIQSSPVLEDMSKASEEMEAAGYTFLPDESEE